MSTVAAPKVIIGIFKDGKIVLPPGVDWPHGTSVRIDVVKVDPAKELEPTIWEKLKKYDGLATDLPADLAQNLDHYLHGHPKK